MTLKNHLSIYLSTASMFFAACVNAQLSPLNLEGRLIYNCVNYTYISNLDGIVDTTFAYPEEAIIYPDTSVVVNGTYSFSTDVYFEPGDANTTLPFQLTNFFEIHLIDPETSEPLYTLTFGYDQEMSYCPEGTMDLVITFPEDLGNIQGSNIALTLYIPPLE